MRRTIYRAAMAARILAGIIPAHVPAIPLHGAPIATAAHVAAAALPERQPGGISWRGIYGRAYDRPGRVVVAAAEIP